MANPFSVPLPVYDFSVLGEIGNAYNTARSQAQNAETQRQFAENAKAQHERESAEELRRRDEFEMKKADRRANAIKSAGELIKLGRTAEAQALLSQHGFDVTPEMGAPTVVTPQPVDIMRGAQAPVEQPAPVGQHSGAPITDMRAPVDVQPEPMPQPEPTLDPAAFLQPGTPTGALSLSMGGKPAGRIDPAEEQRFRAERAARVEGALGPLGDKITAIADLAARGDLDANQAAALYRMIQADDSLAARNKQAEEQRRLHLTAEQQIEQRQLDRESAERRAAKRAAAGGGGTGGGMAAFIDAAGKLKPGDQIPPEIAPLAKAAGLKPNQVAAEVDKYRNSGKKSEKGSGVLTQKQLGEADQGIRDLDRLIAEIERNPKAWDEYRANSESWARSEGMRKGTLGSIGMMTHLMDARPEQGLKSAEAKRVFQYQEKLNTSIAKSFGGVITQGDREAAGSQQANFAIDPQEKLRQLKEMRADIVAKRAAFTASDAPEAGGGNQLAPRDQEAVDWANAHPSDPRAKKILQLHGM